MKKIFTLFVLFSLGFSLSVYGACPLDKLKTDSVCTGGASKIGGAAGLNAADTITEQEQSNREDLIRMYQIPTISSPSSFKNGFPILNPAANCAFGMCQPR